MLDDLFEREISAKPKKDLWPHQIRAIEMLRQSLAGGNRRVVVAMPTAAGKTVFAAKIIEGARAKGNKVIFTAPAISLINQTVKSFRDEGLRDIGVMQANHPLTNPLAGVQVATVQTLQRREIPEAAMVIVDECHTGDKVVTQLMAERPDVFFVGLSATPWAKGMGLRWQDMVVPCTINQLIEIGRLSRFAVYAPDIPDLSGVKVSKGEYAEAGLMEVMGEAKLLGNVVTTWLEKGEDRPTLAFGVNCQHAKDMADAFARAGIASAYVDAATDSVQRDSIGKAFARGEVRIICSVRTMTTGVDLPVSCIIDAAPTKSEILHVQKIGRGLRINPGTEDLVVLDHAGNSLRLGLVTDIHHDRLDMTKPGEKKRERNVAAEKLPNPCVECGVLHVGRSCPACGHERRPPSMRAAEGDLVMLSGQAVKAHVAAKRAWWAALCAMQREKGWSDGRTAHSFRDKWGEWPARGWPRIPGPVPQEVRNFVKAKAIAWAKAQKKRDAA